MRVGLRGAFSAIEESIAANPPSNGARATAEGLMNAFLKEECVCSVGKEFSDQDEFTKTMTQVVSALTQIGKELGLRIVLGHRQAANHTDWVQTQCWADAKQGDHGDHNIVVTPCTTGPPYRYARIIVKPI